MNVQYLLNGAYSGIVIALVGAGFYLVYRTSGHFHFGYPAFLTVAPYVVLSLFPSHPYDTILASLAAIALVSLLAASLDVIVYRRLRRRRATPTLQLLAGLGIYAVLQNSISLKFGDEALSFSWWGELPTLPVFGAVLSTIQCVTAGVSIATLASLWVVLRRSHMGLSMEAVASDPELATIRGVRVERVHLYAMLGSAVCASLAGILIAADTGIAPTMGMAPYMSAIVAVMLGGRSIAGMCIASLGIGLVQNLSVIWIPARWQDALTFLVLLIYLMTRRAGSRYVGFGASAG